MTDYEKLLQYSLRILSKKRYTVFEITKKLMLLSKKLHGGSESLQNENQDDPIEKVVERLKELNYLNDQAYTEDYINERIRLKPRGKILIMRELTHKGIDKDQINEHLEKKNIDEAEMADRVLERKLHSWAKYPVDKQKNKAFMHLASKGFGRDAIYKAIKQHYNQR